MHQLYGSFTNNVHPQQFPGLGMKDEFEQTRLIADDLCLSDLVKRGNAGFIGDPIGS